MVYICTGIFCTVSMLFVTLGTLVKELRSDFNFAYEKISIGSLFKITGDPNKVDCAHLLIAKGVPAELTRCLCVVGRKHQNDLFDTYWRQQCDSCGQLASFTAVQKEVCEPVVKECVQLLQSLEERCITLEEVERCFWKFEIPELSQNLLKLCEGIRECFPTNTTISLGKSWIPSVIKDIQVYKRISTFINTANVILKLKISMNLTGDFVAVDTLAKQVCYRLFMYFNEWLLKHILFTYIDESWF